MGFRVLFVCTLISFVIAPLHFQATESHSSQQEDRRSEEETTSTSYPFKKLAAANRSSASTHFRVRCIHGLRGSQGWTSIYTVTVGMVSDYMAGIC